MRKNKMQVERLEKYRATMNYDVLKSWALDAQEKLNALANVLEDLIKSSTATYSASPEGRDYLLKAQGVLDSNLEKYRESMTEDVLHSWSKDAESKIASLSVIVSELQLVKTPTYSASPEGRAYLKTIQQSLDM